MRFYPNPVKIVFHSEFARTITVMDGCGNRHTFELPDGSYQDWYDRIRRCIKGGFPTGAWAALRKGKEVHEREYERINIQEALRQSIRNNHYAPRPGMVAHIPPGVYKAKILDVETTDFGMRVKIKVGEKEDIMAKHDSKNYPDKDYRFTAIAPEAQSLTYRGQRQWFKTKAACKAFCEDVFAGEHPKRFVLAIVEAKDLIEPKQKIDTVTTVLSR